MGKHAKVSSEGPREAEGLDCRMLDAVWRTSRVCSGRRQVRSRLSRRILRLQSAHWGVYSASSAKRDRIEKQNDNHAPLLMNLYQSLDRSACLRRLSTRRDLQISKCPGLNDQCHEYCGKWRTVMPIPVIHVHLVPLKALRAELQHAMPFRSFTTLADT